jgi:hypothetical protein
VALGVMIIELISFYINSLITFGSVSPLSFFLVFDWIIFGVVLFFIANKLMKIKDHVLSVALSASFTPWLSFCPYFLFPRNLSAGYLAILEIPIAALLAVLGLILSITALARAKRQIPYNPLYSRLARAGIMSVIGLFAYVFLALLFSL